MAPSGTWSRIASPWPTSSTVIRSPFGRGGGVARRASPRHDEREEQTGDRCRAPGPRPAGPHEHGEEQGCAEEAEQRAPGLDLRVRQAADRPSAEREVPGQPPVEPGEGGAASGSAGWSTAAASARPRSGATTGAASALASERVDGDRAEVQPEDRRGDRTARGRDARRPARASPGAGSPRASSRSGDEDEDRGHGRERELEPGLEQAVRIPREQDGSADEQEVPAVARTRREPGERGEPAGDPRPHDGRLPAHREHVRAHGCEGADLARPSAGSRASRRAGSSRR